ncbi:hypothetical protein ACSFA3_19955 [Variovorax sp. RHLX14]|uniref:hypothetical protein n=1 Tax=Variovorax sp. RHLX14 TaxID=1259731 RepID=UPI003F4675B3
MPRKQEWPPAHGPSIFPGNHKPMTAPISPKNFQHSNAAKSARSTSDVPAPYRKGSDTAIEKSKAIDAESRRGFVRASGRDNKDANFLGVIHQRVQASYGQARIHLNPNHKIRYEANPGNLRWPDPIRQWIHTPTHVVAPTGSGWIPMDPEPRVSNPLPMPGNNSIPQEVRPAYLGLLMNESVVSNGGEILTRL